MCNSEICNAIFCGDCLEVMKDFPDNFIDLTVTSPPYDNRRQYNGFVFDFKSIAQQLFRVTKQGGVVVWVVADATVKGSETGTSFKQALYFKEIGFNIHDTMIYSKPNFNMPASNRYHSCFEFMFVFSKGAPKTFNPIKDRLNKYDTCWGKNTVRQEDGEMLELKKNTTAQYGMRFNVWNMNTVGQENPCKKLPHPAMCPQSLVNDHIYSWSNEGDVVLDPMCGSGTSCIAAYNLNRKYIGIDISSEYCELAKSRLKDTYSLFNTEV